MSTYFYPLCSDEQSGVIFESGDHANRFQAADLVLINTAVNYIRATSVEFLFPIRYEKIAYLYPSHVSLNSSFAVLKIFTPAVSFMFPS